MENELVIEIGTEEIPALFLRKAETDLKEKLHSELNNNSLDHGDISTFSTPRRLVAYIENLNYTQKDVVVENFGPPLKVAFDDDGKPTKAGLGFARSQNVDIKKLEIVERNNGEFLCYRNKIKGKKTSAVLKDIIPGIITSLNFRKSMRWGNYKTTFARPIRWLAAVYNGKSVVFEIENIKSSNKSFGHRFTSPKQFKFTDWAGYTKELEDKDVIIDASEREKLIVKKADAAAKKLNGRIHYETELMETVVYIVEHPTVLTGEFEEKYLKLPKEVLISVMKNHQKYFPVYSANGKRLLPNFIFVSGIPSKKPKTIIKGNERVIRARFSDAEFFFKEDSRKHLSEYNSELENMVYLSQIGSYYEKVERLKKISDVISGELNLDNKTSISVNLIRAAELSKADLATQMVFEFPELQGTMGKYYAEISGEDKDVAKAIEEHYMPLSRDGELPETYLGSLLSIVEKIDNICSCFIVGLKPTGSADPYALRRQAIGIIKIVIERKLNLSVNSIFSKSIELTLNSIDKQKKDNLEQSEFEVLKDIVEFISDRFKNLLVDEGYSVNVIDSVISLDFDNIPNSFNKIKALEKFRKQKGFGELAVAFKRVVNIAKDDPVAEVDANLFRDNSERVLYDNFIDIKNKTDVYFDNQGITTEKDYTEALNLIKTLKEPVDNFFDNVMVMDKDEKLKNNRLALLSEIKELFFQISDFSKI